MFFSKSHHNDNDQETTSQDIDRTLFRANENVVAFAVDDKGDVLLRISTQNTTIRDAENLARVMYLIGRGAYQTQLIEMLVQISSNREKQEFIEQVINYWSKLIDNQEQTGYYNDNEPLISPSKFSQLVQSGTKNA